MKFFLTIFLLFSTFYFLFSVAIAAEPQNLQQAIEAKLNDLKVVKEEIVKTQKEIEETQKQQKSLNRELTVINQSINQVNLYIKAGEINISKLNLELAQLEEKISKTQNSIALKLETIAQLLRELQQKDRESLLVALLKHPSLAAIFSEAQTIHKLNSQLAFESANLKVLHNELAGKFNDRSVKKAALESEQRDLKNRRAILQDQKSARSALLTQTKNQEKLYRQQLTKLEKKQQAISDEIDAIEDELRKTFDPTILPVKRPGVLAWPVANPRITQNWGERSWLYRGKPHNGVDFGAAVGTPIFAADDGEVIGAANNGRYQYGRYVVIKHDNNLATLYAHLSKQTVSQGQAVKRGDLVGYSGNTGYSFGPHLHFGLYWAPSLRFEDFPSCCGLVPVGITIDPLDYL